MPVGDRRLPAGKWAAVAAVGVAVDDGSIVDIVQRRSRGSLAESAEALEA